MKVIVVSCDKYLWLAPMFLYFYKMYWPDNPYQTEYITEMMEVKGMPTFCAGNLSWSKRLVAYLESYNEEKIIVMLDDYIIRSPVQTSIVKQAEKLCVNDIGQIRLSVYNRHCCFLIPSEIKGYKEYPLNAPYSISMHPAVWQKEFLLECLNIAGGDISSTEVVGSKRIYKSKKRILWSDFPAISCEGLAGYVKKGKIEESVLNWVRLYYSGSLRNE